MYKLELEQTNKSVNWALYSSDGSRICEYIFKSKEEGSSIGKELLKVTMLRFAIMDVLNCDCIEIQNHLKDFEFDYINYEVKRFVKYSKSYHNLDVPIPKIKCSKLKSDITYSKINLNSEGCLLGYTGGKDSTLSLELLKEKYNNIKLFKFNFDNELFKDDYYSTMKILNFELYKKVSTSNYYEINKKDYYQEEDMHAIYAAPFFNLNENTFSNLAVGLPWDVLNNKFGNEDYITSEFVLTENQESLNIFNKLMNSYGLINFKIFSPIATLNSFAVYNILLKIYGVNGLKSFNSCWNPTINNEPCGRCLKCKRVNFIYHILGVNNEDESAVLLNNEMETYSLDYLFGSISIMKLLDKFNNKEINNIDDKIFIDEDIKKFDNGFSKLISQKYKLEIVSNPLI